MKNLACLAALILWAVACVAQSAPPTQLSASNDTGLSPHTPYSLGVGNVNLSNGNLTLELPLINLPGRAGNNLSLALQYDSKVWVPHYVISGDGSTIVYTWQTEKQNIQIGQFGWRLNVPLMTPGAWETDSNGYQTGYYPDIVTTKDGSKRPIGENRFCCGQELDSHEGDLISIDVSSPDFAIRTVDGDAIHFPTLGGNQINTVDSNGNISSDFVDTLNRNITLQNLTTYPYSPHYIKYYDSNGSLQTITLNYSTLTLFQTSGQYQVSNPSFALPRQMTTGTYKQWVTRPATNSQFVLLTSVVLPDNSQYSFTYNGYGELTQITFPTGGYAQYTYAAFTHLENYWWGPGYNMAADFREVTSRIVCDGAGLCGTTTYAPTVTSLNINNTATDVVDASGTSAAHLTRSTFSQGGGVQGEVCDKFYSPRETTRLSYAGPTNTSQLLRTVATTYNSFTGGACGDTFLPTRVTTTLNDVSPNLVKKEEFDYDTYTAYLFYPFNVDPVSQTAQNISVPIDNVIAHREYDFGSGSPGPLIRTTQTDFLKTSSYTIRSNHILNRKSRVAILDGGAKKSETKYEYDSYTEGIGASGAVQHQSVGNYRGNLTAIDNWVDTTNSYLETRFQYDDAGNAIKAKDPKNNVTLMSYADSWGNGTCVPSGGSAAAYLTSVTNAASQVTSANYNSCIGTMSQITDPNLQSTSYSYDLFGRLTDAALPLSGEIKLMYLSPTTIERQEKRTIAPDWVTSYMYLDGLGRTKQTQLVDSSDGDVFVDTTYDVEGRVSTVSNPHRSGSLSTDGTTIYSYDALGRTTSIQQPDGINSKILTSYLGNITTVTDEASKKKKTVSDGLGRLTQVFEDPTGSNYETDYKYNVLDNLTCVEQHGGVTGTGCSSDPSNDATSSWRVRRFTYDSLSRLLSAKNPESGTITYTYSTPSSLCSGDASAVCTRLDARGITTTYSYVDSLNRLTAKTYSNGNPSVSYTYDSTSGGNNGKGRRTGMSVGASGNSASWVFDARGRVSSVVRTVNGYNKSISYGYNPDSSVSSIAYPSGRVVNYTYNPAGRPIRAHGVSENIDYVGSNPGVMFYWPNGALNSAKLGANIVLNDSYNSRLQPLTLSAVSGSNTLMSRTYNFHLSAGDNGNVWGVTDNIDALNISSRPIGSVTFTYDTSNRITQFKTTGTDCTSLGGRKNSGNNYTIDAWGNLTNKGSVSGLTGCVAETLNEPVGVNNRFSSGANRYDAAGNMTSNGAYVFDAENRITGGGGLTFKYDGDGSRISKTGTTNELYWLGAGSEILAESNATANLTSEYIFFGGKRVARIDIGDVNRLRYYVSDHLGSATVIASDSGVVQREQMYYPYGGERWTTGTDVNHYKFTGKERDAETGLDYFGARYYGSNMGRWMSPDWSDAPAPVPYADLTDPQTLNLYGYVRNNPLSRADADGHCATVWECVVAPVVTGVSWAWSSAAAGAGTLIVLGAEMIKDPTGQNFANAPRGGMGIMNADGMLPEAHDPANQPSTSQGQSTPAQPPDDNDTKDTTRAARREAMRQEGIPTSQQPTSQTSTDAGRQYTYEVSKPGGGTQTKIVTNQLKDRNHGPHVEAGAPKPNGQTDPSGRLRHANPKTKVNVKDEN